MNGRAFAQQLVQRLGGRFSSELGLDLDRRPGDIERWFLAATLFGNRISASIAVRTYRTLARAGVRTVPDVHQRSWDDLVELLDQGGYRRYDFRTATRLQQLAGTLDTAWGGRVARLLAECRTAARLEAALDDLPGWGPVTVRLFLRELPLAFRLSVDERALAAAAHLRLIEKAGAPRAGANVRRAAAAAGLDARDLEVALVRLRLRHGDMKGCPGGDACTVLAGNP
jgi:hypothetical protein